MRLSPPKKLVFLLSLILGILGVVAHFIAIPVLSAISFWLVVAGLALLLLGNFIRGL